MRAPSFCALVLAVAAAHLAAWDALAGRLPSFALAPQGTSRAQGGSSRPRVAWLRIAPQRAEEVDARQGGMRAAAGGHPAPGHGAPTPAAAAGPRSTWPVYATRPPPALRLSYGLRQTQSGGVDLVGRAELEWSGPGADFTLRLSTALPGRAPRAWVSLGGFDRAGLAPRALVQRDGARVTRHVALDRAGTPGARSDERTSAPACALAPGAQDRWSWLAQLAAIAEARSGRVQVAHLQVAGLRGELDRWTFRATPDAALPAEAQVGVPAAWRAAPLLHLVREPERPYDLRVDTWLSPAIHHFPIALRLATPPSRWSFVLWLDAGDAPPGRGP